MDYQVSVQSAYPGYADITQLINRSATSGNQTYGTSGQIDLDTQAFYHGAPGLQVQANTPQIIRLFDGPYIAVSPPTTTIFDQFSDYIRFRPGGVSSMNNIYVTLGKTSWSWSGATSYSSNHWSPATGSVTWPESPDDSNDFPFWSTVFNP